MKHIRSRKHSKPVHLLALLAASVPAAGMAQQTISRRLKLEDPIPFDTDELERIARALAVPVESFFVVSAVGAA